MLHKVKGLVLRTTRYSETSVIALLYTDVFGMQSYMINGVRKQKATITQGMLQPLTLVEAEVYHKSSSDIQRLSELHVRPALHRLPVQPPLPVLAMFLAELITRSVREEEANPDFYLWLETRVQLLDLSANPVKTLLQTLLELAGWLGFLPDAGTAEGSWLNLTEGRFERQRDMRSTYARPESAEQLSALLNGAVPHALPQAGRALEHHFSPGTLQDLLLLYQLHLPGFREPRSTALFLEMFF